MKKLMMLLLFALLRSGYCQQIQSVWEIKEPMKIKRAFHVMAESGGRIYVFGGSTGDNEFLDTKSVEMYDPVVNKWTMKAEMPEAIATSCAVAAGDAIYIIGGELNTFKQRTNKVLMYCPSENKWKYMAPMNIPRAFHGAALINNKIYVVGGRESAEEIRSKKRDSLAVYTIEEYDIVRNKWVIKLKLQNKHFIIGAAAVKNKIYILSDTTDNSMLGKSALLEEYDPDNNTLNNKAGLTPSKCDAAVTVYDNKIYILGGWYKNTLSTVEVYDPAADKWEEKANIPFKVQNHQAAALKKTIYLSGGIIYSKNGNDKKNNLMAYYPDKDK